MGGQGDFPRHLGVREEAERGFHADMGDAFKAGRALAYEEVKEIIENRLEMLDEE